MKEIKIDQSKYNLLLVGSCQRVEVLLDHWT